MSSASFYQWRSKYGGMDASLMRRLKELKAENARLKKMYAEERIKSELRQECSGLLKLYTQLSGNLPLERSVHYEEKTHV